MHTPALLTDILPGRHDRHLALATLNDPSALNALNAEMIAALSQALQQWAADPAIAAVFLCGAGGKAFCAGGNVRRVQEGLYHSADFPNPQALAFFSQEYGLYQQMHTYAKPLIIWADGIVMGGGLGLTAAASHRIVTAATRMAMPEISIGLFPDAGGSWFLHRMPGRSGLFLGLTGAAFNGRDALYGQLGDYALTDTPLAEALAALQHADWHNNDAANHDVAAAVLHALHRPEGLPESQILHHWAAIERITGSGGLAAADTLLRTEDFATPWLQQAAGQYRQGCPTSAALTWRLYQQTRHYSVAEVLYLELIVALHCCRNGEFTEGVRALLIDKDKQPRWQRTLAECDATYIDAHFANPFTPGAHPFDGWRCFQAA